MSLIVSVGLYLSFSYIFVSEIGHKHTRLTGGYPRGSVIIIGGAVRHIISSVDLLRIRGGEINLDR